MLAQILFVSGKHCRVQVSTNKKPLQFYLNLSRRLMAEHGEVELSALGLGKTSVRQHKHLRGADGFANPCFAAVSNMVTVAEILKKEGWAVEKSKCCLGARETVGARWSRDTWMNGSLPVPIG